MKNIKIERSRAQAPDTYIASKLVSEVSRYSCDVILKSVSENNVNQQVDLKSILGVSALLANKAPFLEIELEGNDEDAEYIKLTEFLDDLFIGALD